MPVLIPLVSVGWWRRWRKQRTCFHHSRRGRESWISDRIIDYRKMYWCRECGKTWVI